MGMAWGCRFCQSAAGAFLHALLVLLYASLQQEPVDAACASSAPLYYTGNSFAIRQTRTRLIGDSDIEECPFQVWGVATVLVGGANWVNQFYWLDCFHSGLGTTWVRVDPGGSVNNTDVSVGTRISFTPRGSNHLGLYACIASDGAMEYLNITDEVPGLIPVESSVEAFSGDTVTLSTFISTTNGLLTYVQWKDPSGDTVLEYPALGEEVNALPSNLVISDVSPEESGTYNVTVQSREGLNFRGHTLIFLSVLVPSNITGPPPSELTVDEWDETRLVCEARGSPPLTITWSREGSMLPIDSGIQTSSPYSNEDGTVTVTSTLTITGSRYRDRGRYSCSAYNTLTTISHTDTTESTLNINPMIRIESEDLTSNVVLASFGTSLTIQCFGSGNLVWTTPPNQTVFTSYDPSQNVLTLSIPNFIIPARYTCSSDLVAGLEKTILIITDAVLSVFISDEEIFALKGSMVTIPAHIHSVNGVTSVIWYRNGTQLDPESDSRYTATVSDNALATLEIDSLRDEDIGIYVAVVTNSDDIVANASVEVKYPVLPSARVSPSRQTVEVGDSVDVVCATDGTGPLDTQWTAENGDVVADGNRLTIATATLVHSGVYTCTVSSPFSAAQATFDLTVLSECIEGNVTGSTNGRLQLVEMCNSDGVWSPICDNEWTQEDATVVCRELGYQEPKTVRYETINKTMVNAIHNISCRGNETALRDCVSTEPPVNTACQLALVDCSPDITVIVDPEVEDPNDGDTGGVRILAGVLSAVLLLVILTVAVGIVVGLKCKRRGQVKITTAHNPAYDVVQRGVAKPTRQGTSDGRTSVSAVTDSHHSVCMQSNPLYNFIPSQTQTSEEPEYDYVQ